MSLQGVLIDLSSFARPYVYQIAIAIIATLLVIYGSDINRFFKRRLVRQHFIVRTFVFVLVCAFGYGAAIVFLTPLLSSFLASLSSLYLFPIVLVSFIALGMLAEHKHQM